MYSSVISAFSYDFNLSSTYNVLIMCALTCAQFSHSVCFLEDGTASITYAAKLLNEKTFCSFYDFTLNHKYFPANFC